MNNTAKSLALLSLAILLVKAQTDAQERDLIVRMTTPIEVHFRASVPNYGSAFYFQQLGPPADPSKQEPQWRAITGLFLVTAKHVIEPSRIKSLISVKFYLRRPGVSGIDWLPITLSQQDVRERLHVDPNSAADIAALDIRDLVSGEMMKSMPKNPGSEEPHTVPIENYFAVTEDNFPNKSKIKVDAGDDVVVIGYPRQFFDSYNKLPILKSGLLITPVGVRYDNMDAFLIDFKEYEGMSGGVVISKPTDLTVEDDHILIKKGGKDFVFLGVYAGQRYRRGSATGEEKTADVGIGWYYYNLANAISSPPMFSTK